MTTETNLEQFSALNRKRDKHPARSARILTTGFSVAATLGLTSGYAIATSKTSSAEPTRNVVESGNITLPTANGLVGPAAAIASSTPAVMVATAHVASVATAPAAPVATAPAASVATTATQQVTQVKRQKIEVQVSTTSSGSK